MAKKKDTKLVKNITKGRIELVIEGVAVVILAGQTAEIPSYYPLIKGIVELPQSNDAEGSIL